jgi:predicted DCC family thiol-disulfide oxidoreductase YuxK
MSRGLMLYDADCGFCTRIAERVTRWRFDVDGGPLQATDLAALGIDPQRALREMPFVAADGQVAYGHHAWACILATGPWPARMAGRVLASRLLERPAGRVYRWVSEHRGRMPGGTSACSVDGRTLGGD